MRVYALRVPSEPAPAEHTAAGVRPQTPRRRASPSQAEQERRKAWGREWGKVGADHAKLIRANDQANGRR